MPAPLSWFAIVRLGLVQTALGSIVVLTTSTLNRVMVVELALPAMLPGALAALHYAVQMLRPRLGYGSDLGGRRTPWIVGGMVVLACGDTLAAVATAWMARAPLGGALLAIVAFVLVGVGVGAAGTESNLFPELEALFRTYGETGGGHLRKYLHDDAEAAPFGQPQGKFTPSQAIPSGTDLLFYEGLHGAVVTGDVNVAQYPDLIIGVVSIINLEWIQKLHRDKASRGYSTEAVVDTILRRMPDYVNYICPQFAQTYINFQRVPTVDTSNPFIAGRQDGARDADHSHAADPEADGRAPPRERRSAPARRPAPDPRSTWANSSPPAASST